MKLHEYVEMHGCTLEKLSEGKDNPRYEVFMPKGYNFDGLHSLICFDAKDVKERMKGLVLTGCEHDCDC